MPPPLEHQAGRDVPGKRLLLLFRRIGGSIVQAVVDFEISEGGNWEDGKIVFHRQKDAFGPISEASRLALAKLLPVRQRRAQPALDDKILVSQNALAVSALVWASFATSNTTLARQWQANAQKCWTANLQRLSALSISFLDDWAFMAQAALDLARLGDFELYYQHAQNLMQTIQARFAHSGGGYYFTANDHESLVARPKTLADSAIPAGSVVAWQVNHALAAIFDKESPPIEPLVKDWNNSAWNHGQLVSALLQANTGLAVISGVSFAQIPRLPFLVAKNGPVAQICRCLLYTSDAADDM
jgi:uncharacterized protein YyaL (SSP411 family)